ncbi:type VII toxin-antitoxin system HepT family RNase toxin [Tissierella creatinophila]|uniref:DUF86 domain-containing protein n=1 Tax=Tissierella creatinophila DSM 6911 TaxID=1123403 RepID=A0A1U7M2N2_TISCR|nr:DUF86 domain-containing protein [Tissierella creatinophila]OLS01551.1 hypothetical protein TICRE_25900 [Tissierella creatinophila DSM 6911]
MTKDIISLINKKLKELEQNLIFLKNVSFEINRENLKKDIIRYWGIERGIHICIESVIDIANILISSSEIEKPSTYRETILILSELDIIPKNFSKDLAKMVGFRNILVHDYINIDEEIILDVLNNKLNDFIRFTSYINKWVKENY